MPSTVTAEQSEPNAARRRLGWQLAGSGLEVGPGQYPFRLLRPGTQVRYVDRLTPDTRRQVLGELGRDPSEVAYEEAAVELEPDVVADFNVDRLQPVPDASQDFVIASHVLEHLAEPIGFLDEIHRVLKPGGRALVLLPDRRRTEDRFRKPTPLSHLVAEFEAGVTQVSDDHVVEFLKDRGRRLGRSPKERQQTMEHLRDHSFHVHCWDAQEFVDVVLWGITNLGQQWKFVDGSAYEPPIHYEFAYLLARDSTELDASLRAREFLEAWTRWRDRELERRPGMFSTPGGSVLWLGAQRRARAVVRRSEALGHAYRRAGGFAARSRRRWRRRWRRLRSGLPPRVADGGP